MDAIKFWNMHYISGKEIIFTILVSFFCTSSLLSQTGLNKNYNYKDFQKKSYYFGLSLGINSSSFHLDRSQRFIGNEYISVSEAESGIGFNLNMIANLKLGDYFDFRFLPGFTFSERKLLYTENNVDSLIISTEPLESVFFELPFQVRFKSAPYKDKRLFVVGGLKYSYDVASNSSTKKSVLKFSPHDFQYEIGIGMQFFYPYFIFSPEIKFSRGITNTLIYDSQLPESSVLENVFSQYFTLSFHFEG